MKKFILLPLLAILFVQTGCTTFVSKDLIEDRMSKTNNPYNLPVYFSEDEVPHTFKTIGFFEWRKLSFLAHRKKIGHITMKKASKYIKKGKLAKPDAILITDFIHATYIQFVDKHTTVDVLPKPSQSENESSVNEKTPKERIAFPSQLEDPNSVDFPKLRLAGGFFGGFGTSSNNNLGINIRVNRRLPELGTDNLVGSLELTGYLPSRGVTSLFLNLNSHYYLDLQKAGITKLELRPYPLLGLGVNLRFSSNGNGSRQTLSLVNLGAGTEYRLTNEISAFFECSGQFFFDASPGLAMGGGLSYWWK